MGRYANRFTKSWILRPNAEHTRLTSIFMRLWPGWMDATGDFTEQYTYAEKECSLHHSPNVVISKKPHLYPVSLLNSLPQLHYLARFKSRKLHGKTWRTQQLLHSANRLHHPYHWPHGLLKSGMMGVSIEQLFFFFIWVSVEICCWDGRVRAVIESLHRCFYLYRLMVGLWYMHM